jgi:hypothetical protein
MKGLNLQLVVATTTAFVALLYLVCAVFQPVFPSWPMYAAGFWEAMFPGFSWTVPGVLLGLIEAVVYAAAGSALYVWIYNFFATRTSRQARV